LPIFDCHKNQHQKSQGKSGLGVAREVKIDAFWQQALAAALTAAGEGGASAFRPHTRAKTVLALARSFGCLISAFHKAEK
jgi:hypothetical protein